MSCLPIYQSPSLQLGKDTANTKSPISRLVCINFYEICCKWGNFTRVVAVAEKRGNLHLRTRQKRIRKMLQEGTKVGRLLR